MSKLSSIPFIVLSACSCVFYTMSTSKASEPIQLLELFLSACGLLPPHCYHQPVPKQTPATPQPPQVLTQAV